MLTIAQINKYIHRIHRLDLKIHHHIEQEKKSCSLTQYANFHPCKSFFYLGVNIDSTKVHCYGFGLHTTFAFWAKMQRETVRRDNRQEDFFSWKGTRKLRVKLLKCFLYHQWADIHPFREIFNLTGQIHFHLLQEVLLLHSPKPYGSCLNLRSIKDHLCKTRNATQCNIIQSLVIYPSWTVTQCNSDATFHSQDKWDCLAVWIIKTELQSSCCHT